MRLYEVAEEIQFLLNEVYDVETGEVDETSLVKIEGLQKTFEEKCIAVQCYVENMEAERKAIDEAKKRMADRESRLKKKIQYMKDYLLKNMEKTGIKKISSPYFDITLCKNPPAVEVFDEKEIPKQYEKIEIKLDTARMRADLMNGVVIPGAMLINRNSIRIK